LTADVEGDIAKVERTIRITEIRVKYHLPISTEEQETTDRVLKIHPAGCPAHESVKDSIRIKIEAEYQFR
jgi:uncharacterized OsmC-like protein